MKGWLAVVARDELTEGGKIPLCLQGQVKTSNALKDYSLHV